MMTSRKISNNVNICRMVSVCSASRAVFSRLWPAVEQPRKYVVVRMSSSSSSSIGKLNSSEKVATEVAGIVKRLLPQVNKDALSGIVNDIKTHQRKYREKVLFYLCLFDVFCSLIQKITVMRPSVLSLSYLSFRHRLALGM